MGSVDPHAQQRLIDHAASVGVEVTAVPAEPDWWRARDRDGVLWFREPDDDGNNWRVSGGGLLAHGWQWDEAYELWGPFTCADGEPP